MQLYKALLSIGQTMCFQIPCSDPTADLHVITSRQLHHIIGPI